MYAEKKTILIVDDEELNRAILFEMLYRRYRVLEAENGREALEILEKEHQSITVVLLDVIMPVMDGFQLLEAMKEREWLKEMPVILITAESSESAAIKGYELGASDIINKPFNPNIVIRRVENMIQLSLHQFHLETMIQEQMSTLEQQARKIKQTSNFVIDVLSTVVEFRSGESGSHIKRMRSVTEFLMQTLSQKHPELYITDEQIELVSSASTLHDIGKIAIPDAVLNKPGKLTAEEFEIMKTHTTKGCEILKSIDYVQDEEYFSYCYEICRHHHERWDGRGYPDGIKGNDIPLCAQVVSIVDVYDALTNERVYKPPFTHEKALEMIQNGECGIFNPMLVECFLDVSDEIKQNKENPLQKPSVEAAAPAKEEKQYENEAKEELASKRTLRLLELERQKYHIVSEMSGEIIFDFDFKTDKLLFSEKFKEVFGKDICLEKACSTLPALGIISKEDLKRVLELVNSLTTDNPTGKMEAQLITADGSHRWFEIYITALWDQELQKECVGYLGKIASIHELKMESTKWKQEAELDGLTGLYNRRTMETIVTKYINDIGNKVPAALLFIDIDNFKMVNDTLGHLAGDELLRIISTKMKDLSRSNDVLSRVGGDEFVIFLMGSYSEQDLSSCADRLCGMFRNITLNQNAVQVSGSVGIARYPDDAKDYTELLRHADKALYSAKRKGKDQYAFYGREMDESSYPSLLTEMDET